MKWKHIILYLLIVVLSLAFGKMVKVLTIGFWKHPSTTGYYFWSAITAIIIIIGCWYIAKRLNLMKSGGFHAGSVSNYWMLAMPLLFPGLVLFFRVEKIQCIDFSLLFYVAGCKIFLSALMEEVMFRGIILAHLVRNNPERSVHYSCIVSSLFFSLTHLINLQHMDFSAVTLQFIYAFLMGMLFAALLLRTGNVWLLGLIHGAINFFSNNFCSTAISDTAVQDVTGATGLLAGSLLFFLTLSPILIMYVLLLTRYNKVSSGIK